MAEFDAAAAKAAGHSDEDIARIQNQIQSARNAGYSDDQIMAELQKEEAATQSGAYTIGGAAKAAVRSAGEGVASILDLPTQASVAIQNAPKYSTNAAIEAAKTATPEQLKERGIDPAIVNMQPEELRQSPNYVTSGYREIFGQPDPNHPWINTAASIAGPAIVEAGLTGGSSLLTVPGALAAARRAAVTTGGTIAGKEAGGAAGEAIGGDTGRGVGEFVGSAIGGGVTPSLATAAPYKAGNALLTEADSPTRLAVVQAAGVTPSMGLVGNKTAATLEDATVGVPFAGNPAYNARRTQYEQIDQGLRDVAESARGGPSVGDINKSTIGQQAHDLGVGADIVAAQKKDAAFAPMKAQVGPDTVADPTPIRQALQGQVASATTGVDDAAPAYLLNLVDQNRLKPLPGNVPKVFDPNAEAILQLNLARAKTALQGAQPGSPLATAAQNSIQQIQQAILNNRGPTFENLIKLRTTTANKLDPAKDFSKSSLLDAKSVLTDAQRETAMRQGVTPQEFDRANAEYGRLAEQQAAHFQPLIDAAGQGAAYGQMFGGSQANNVDRLNALSEHAPNELSQLLANEFELRTRGQGAGFPGPSPETLNTKTVPKWWQQQPEEFRTAVAAPMTPERGQIAALMKTMDYDARRPTRTLPGTGGNTIGAPQAMFQNPVGLGSLAGMLTKAVSPGVGAGIGAGVGGPIGAAVGAVLPTATAYGVGRAFTSPAIVQRIVHPPGWLQDATLGRLLAAGLGGRQQ